MDASQLLALYLEEDIGSGDATGSAIFTQQTGSARIVAREPMFVAGLARMEQLFAIKNCTTILHMNDGSWVESGAVVATVSGATNDLLAVERTALNLLGRMSAVATVTRQLVEALGAACSGATVAATRKTMPGMRIFEKEAVALAGGDPHRSGLWDAAMVKDNHKEALGSIGAAVAAVREHHPAITLTAEVETLAEAHEAAHAGADWLLIDNQDPATGEAWAKALWDAHPRIKIEASGGITPATVLQYGWADRISLGALTRDAGILDLGLDWGSA